MSNSTPPQLQPTFIGHISSTMDALILFEACLSGQRAHVPRRPHDRERDELIRSGHVFIYEENASGIKRWTDGYNWSPSRILGNFLIYRELEKAFPPGEKKRAMKRKKSDSGVAKIPQPGSRATSVVPPAGIDNNANGRDLERSLIGSLVDSYPFKEGGLVKKTISVKWNGVPHHLVSYYSIEDVTNGNLTNPSKHPELSQIIPRSGLISSQDFRVPVDQEDYGYDERTGLITYGIHGLPEYGTPGGSLPRSMSLPTVNMDLNMYGANPHHFGMPPNYQPHLDVPPHLANNHYMHPSPNGYSMDPMRSRSTSMATIPYTPQPVTMMESPSRRQSSAYEIATSAGSDPNLASLATIPETRHLSGLNYYQGAYQLTHRPSVAMSAASGSDLFETSRELSADQLLSFDRTPQGLSLDDVDRNWFSNDFSQSHLLGAPQAAWPRGVSHT